MARGNRCPNCGELKFHANKDHPAVYKCSGCEVVGWWTSPGSPGAGRGSTCQSCGGKTMRKVYKSKDFTVQHCNTCKATVLI